MSITFHLLIPHLLITHQHDYSSSRLLITTITHQLDYSSEEIMSSGKLLEPINMGVDPTFKNAVSFLEYFWGIYHGLAPSLLVLI